MTRALTSSEVGICCEAARKFYEEGKLPGRLVENVFIAGWQERIDTDAGVIFGSFNDNTGEFEGGLGAVIYPDPNSGDPLTCEMFWYMKPECRGNGMRLLEAYENWAKSKGAHRIYMIHLLELHPDVMRKIYERRGYKPVEVGYSLEVTA